ncbi:hypothetical protein CATMIT_02003, partial [Catenibacterium mitsuokai DSM 15897]
IRVRQPDLDRVAGFDRGGAGHRHGPDAGADLARPVRVGVSAVRRAQGGGVDRYRAGDLAGARRAVGGRADLEQDRRRRGHPGWLEQARGRASGPLPHDPVGRQPALQRPARHRRAARWPVGDARELLGLQPVHHPARAGGQGLEGSAEGHRVRCRAEDHPAGDRGGSRYRRGDAGAGPATFRRCLPGDDGAAAARRARPGVRGAGRGDRRLAGLEDQFGGDHLHPGFLRQAPPAGRRAPAGAGGPHRRGGRHRGG